MPLPAATEPHLLHFDLAGSDAGHGYTLHVAQQRFALSPHSRATRSDARAENPFLRLLPDEAVSHYAEAALPSDAVALMWVTRPEEVDGLVTDSLVSLGIHVPREARLRDVRHKLGAPPEEEIHPKLAFRGLQKSLLRSDLQALHAMPDLIAAVQDPYETAVSLLFQHPELINFNAKAATGGPVTVIERCIRRALSQYGLLVESIRNHPADWSRMVRAQDVDGSPLLDDEGQPAFVSELHGDVRAALPNVLSRALVLVNQEEDLRGQSWSLQYGNTVGDYAGRVAPKAQALKTALRGAGDVRWRLKNLTPTSGLEFEPDVRFTPAAPGINWRAEGTWSSNDERAVGPFDEIAQKALAEGRLHAVFNAISGVLQPAPGRARTYIVALSGAEAGRTAQGECRLNGDGTALEYLITTNSGPYNDAYFAVKEGDRLRKLHSIAVRNAGNSGNLMVVLKNHWLRHLSAYVEFVDAAGRAKAAPGWNSRFPLPGTRYDDHPTKRYVGMVGPVETMMGIPLPTESSHFSVPVPDDAATVRFVWGGLGQGRNDDVACPAGAIMTVIVEMALPVVMLAAGAGLTASGGLLKLVRKQPVIGAVLAHFTSLFIALNDDPAKAVWLITKKLIPAAAKAVLGELSQYIAGKIIEGGAKKALPFINMAMFLADAAATMAQLAQTTSAVRQSPRAHVTEITRTIDLRITITSSRLYKKFPDHHHHLAVVVAYDSGATLPKLVKPLPPETISDDIVVDFSDVPAAGNLRVLVFFYAENDWQSGQGASAWTKAEGAAGSHTLVVPAIEIEINEVPLGKWSVYEHMQKLVMRDGRRAWQAGPPPQATKATPSPVHGTIEKLHAITMAQYPEMIGYAWQATDQDLPPDETGKPPTANSLFVQQNLSVLQRPQEGHAKSSVGFSISGGIAYDMVSPDDGSGRNFFVDPSRGVYDEVTNRAGGFHLRRVRVAYGKTPDFNPRRNESWGRFPDSVDGMVVHPHGYVFAIRRGTHKLYRITLPDIAASDDHAPMATLSSGEGARDGLMKSPIAVALALDARVLVLESGNNKRVQCFDVNGNPVAYFADPAKPGKTPILTLRSDGAAFTLLDMAVEAKGHIFILGHTGSGKSPADYRLDLYDPAGVYLTSTGNFTAARITVDLLRNVFALNYEVLDTSGRRPEPGVSQWRPPAPTKPKL